MLGVVFYEAASGAYITTICWAPKEDQSPLHGLVLALCVFGKAGLEPCVCA